MKYQIGDKLKVLRYIRRQDGKSELRPGDIVKVLQAYSFTHQGKELQDITVQRANDAHVAIIHHDGDFSHAEEGATP